jgi:hypothetical protein
MAQNPLFKMQKERYQKQRPSCTTILDMNIYKESHDRYPHTSEESILLIYPTCKKKTKI